MNNTIRQLASKVANFTRKSKYVIASFLGIRYRESITGYTIDLTNIQTTGIIFLFGVPIGMLLFPETFSLVVWFCTLTIITILSHLFDGIEAIKTVTTS